MSVEKVSISMPEAVLEAARAKAKKENKPLSRVITAAVVNHLGLICPHCSQVYSKYREEDGRGPLDAGVVEDP